jgi:broad specificity phosphatase PhoE
MDGEDHTESEGSGSQEQAQQIERNQPDPKPAFTVSPLLREQHFGVAEGKPWGEKGGFNRGPGRTFKFPEGESLEDVRNRANEA